MTDESILGDNVALGKLDPVLIEILSNKVAAAAEEMSYTLQRTGRTLFVKETADFATGLIDLNGKFFAYPRNIGVTNFMGLDCQATLSKVAALEDGDVILTNHPYESQGLATHLPDLHMIAPYFHHGKIVAYGWCFIHSSDIGGYVPSSVSPSNREIFQEGLMIPPMKIVKAGEINPDFMILYQNNCRTPADNAGDIRAMLAALRTGGNCVAGIIQQHGIEDFLNAQEALQAYSASKVREVFRRIPDGTYDFWDYMDDDFVSPIPFRLKVKLSAKDGLIDLDFAGTDPQVDSAYNIPTAGKRHPWLTQRLIAFACTYDKTIPINGGMYRPISVSVPYGSTLNPAFPAAVGVRHATATRVSDAVNGALMTAAPSLLKAPSGGVAVPVVLVEPGSCRNQRNVLVVEPVTGGDGGREGCDGVDGRDGGIGNLSNNPIESVENDSRIIIHRFGVRSDSGGPGQWRGGVGQILQFEVLQDGSSILARGMERFKFAPWGVRGGRPGAVFEVEVRRKNGILEKVGKISQLNMQAGDVITIRTPGGGGFGDPLKRDPEAVRLDVERGFVSLAAAARDYAVVIHNGQIDLAETARLRNERKAEFDPTVAFDFGPERRAWETLFDDATLTELVEHLSRLPPMARNEIRQHVIASAFKSVDALRGNQIMEAYIDLAEARRNVEVKVAELARSE